MSDDVGPALASPLADERPPRPGAVKDETEVVVTATLLQPSAAAKNDSQQQKVGEPKNATVDVTPLANIGHVDPLVGLTTTKLDTAADTGDPMECPVCFNDELNTDEVYTFPNCGHVICRETCLGRLIKLAEKEKSLLRCPMCRGAVHADQVTQLLGREHLYAAGYAAMEVQHLLVANQQAFVLCPRRDDPEHRCQGAVELAEGMQAGNGNGHQSVHVTCPACRLEFCAGCRQTPYHYGTTCEEAREHIATWAEFCRLLSRQGDATTVEKEEQMRRYNQLRQDEENKGRHCAHCPNCQKIVYKMGGCDTMKCGQDADGGNDQSGCGTVFGWEEARSRHPYRPQIPKMPDIGQLERLLFNDREAVQSMQGPGTHPMHFRCQLCDEHPIKGLRFECMNCPGEVSLCRNCMMATQRLPGHLHAADHTFRIYEPSIPPPRQSDDRGRDDISERDDDDDDEEDDGEWERIPDEWRAAAFAGGGPTRGRRLGGVDGERPQQYRYQPPTPPPEPIPSTPWNCTQCTFENPTQELLVCEMCGSRRAFGDGRNNENASIVRVTPRSSPLARPRPQPRPLPPPARNYFSSKASSNAHSTAAQSEPPRSVLGGHARALGGTRGGRSRLLDTPPSTPVSSTQLGSSAAVAVAVALPLPRPPASTRLGPTPPSVQPGVWCCSVCTLENPATLMHCDACGSDRGGRPEGVGAVDDDALSGPASTLPLQGRGHWACEVEPRVWIPYNNEDQVNIERAFFADEATVHVCPGTGGYGQFVIDFRSMSQRSESGSGSNGTRRSVMRIVE